jgi:hypothetical protein
MSWQGPLDRPSLYQRRLDVDVNPQPPPIVTEAELARQPTQHPGRATLRFAVSAPERMDVCMHVFLGQREKLRTIFQRGFHRKLEDQARRPVPDAALTFFPCRALAHRVGGFEELAPATRSRSHHGAAVLD